MIVAVTCCFNEADIIEASLRHVLAEGVDRVLVSDGLSTDGTRRTLARLATDIGRVTIYDDPDPVWRQVARTSFLVSEAVALDADWVVPFDADEFWYSPSGRPLADVLRDCSAQKAYAPMFRHHSWELREVAPKRLPKVAFRPGPGVFVAPGAHEVSLPGGEWGLLALRELQYRGPEHFIAKTRSYCERIASEDAARGDAIHHTSLREATDEELLSKWNEIRSTLTVLNPIPSRSPYRPVQRKL